MRNPFRVAEALGRRGFHQAEVRPDSAGLPRDGSWLAKPLASGGGRSIGRLEPETALIAEPCYFQRWIAGLSYSAIFLASSGRAELMGVSRQLIGAPGSPFAYRGSIGPCDLSGQSWSRLSLLGQVLASTFCLVGLFGVDFVLPDDEPWIVEINPRYTASVEVLELALGCSLFAEHVGACLGRAVSSSGPTELANRRRLPLVVGKAILYAVRSLAAPEIEVHEFQDRDPFAIPSHADIPCPGTPIAEGEPVMTVFATAEDVVSCEEKLKERTAFWERRLVVGSRGLTAIVNVGDLEPCSWTSTTI